MIRKTVKLLLLATLFTTPFMALAESSQEKGLAIAKETDQKDSGWKDGVADLTMTLKTKQGEEAVRQLKISMLEDNSEGDKSLVVFETPKDVKDTVLLTFSHKKGDDEQWLYLPALKRTKRIASSNKSGPFVGSEFAYEDMVPQEVEKYTYNYVRDETLGSEECFVVERFPVDKSSGYTKQVVWVDKSHHRIHKIDYYDRKNSLLKTLTLSGYKQYEDNYWRPDQSEMVNHQTGKSTLLSFSNYALKKGIDAGQFNPSKIDKRS